jgi:radical SAM protein with 4Fe4S-binding SPASM domain
MNVFTHLEIETVGSCNRTCGTCLRQTYAKKDNPTHYGRFPVTSKIGEGMKMPTSMFKRIIDQAVDMGFDNTVCLQHFNEPLLDERLPELGEYIKSKPQIKGALSACSNMDLITEEAAKELDGLFDHFVVALYMPREKQIEREKYLLNLFKKTRLDFTQGVHVVTHYSPFSNTTGIIEEQQHKPCTHYNPMLIIAYNGTILHCCDDYVGHFGLGNVNTMSLKEIWEGKVHQELVETLSKPGGRLNYSYCSVCPR